jgi:hypothetical protein
MGTVEHRELLPTPGVYPANCVSASRQSVRAPQRPERLGRLNTAPKGAGLKKIRVRLSERPHWGEGWGAGD